MTAPGNELEVVKQNRAAARALLNSYRGELASVMPSHGNAEAFMGLAIAYVRRDLSVLNAASRNPGSLVLALRECAALGHLPMRGTFSLVPFNNRNAPGGIEVVGIEEYRGVIERMYRAGGVESVHVELVRANDTNRDQTGQPDWQPWMALPDHRIDPYADEETRGEIRAVYAYARLRGGGVSQVVWMNAGEIRKHEKDTPFWRGPWRPDMVRKTALHKLERYVPTSVEYRAQMGASAAAAAKMTLPPGTDDPGLRRYPEADDPDAPAEGEVHDGPPAATTTRVQATAGRPQTTDGPDWSDVETRRPPQ